LTHVKSKNGPDGYPLSSREFLRAKEDGADVPDEVACPDCDVRMSRRILKKADVDTGLVEEVYRCPICGAVTTRWVNE
jgi:rubredoxin